MLEWFRHVKKRRNERLRWKDTVRRDMKAWKMREELDKDRESWKCLCKIRYSAQGDASEK